MKLKIDEAVLDLLTGEQMELDKRPTTLRHLIIKAGITPLQTDPDHMEDAAQAYEIAARAAAVPTGGELELTVDEASFIKTRAFKALFVFAAGPLHAAIEAAAAQEAPKS